MIQPPAPLSRPPLSRPALAAIAFAALAGAAAVALGAAAAHVLAEAEARLAETASRYALFHALAMIAAALVTARIAAPWPRRLAGLAIVAFGAGIMLFSGALAALAFGHVIPHSAPLGGMALIAGWLALAGAAIGAALTQAD